MHRFLYLFLATLLLTIVGSATPVLFAQGSSSADADEKFAKIIEKAGLQYQDEKYEEAVALFLQAYKVKPKSALIYNVARIYDTLDDSKNAAKYYEIYTQEPETDPSAMQESIDRLANIAFADKDYERALEFFLKAEKLKPGVGNRYNISRTLEKKGSFEEALKAYESLVKDPDLNHETRKDVLERLKTLREMLKLNEKKEENKTPTPPPKPSHTLSYVLMGTGGALLLGGGIFAGLTAGENSNFEDAATLGERRDAADSGATFGVVADSLFVGGSILAVSGLINFLLTDSGSSEVEEGTTSFMLVPQIRSGEIGVGLGFEFF